MFFCVIMAWDTSFDHTWLQRIEKEERAYLRGEMEKKAKEKEERRRARREMAGSASCSELSYSSSRLSAAGSQALMHSSSASALGSEAGSAMSPERERRRHRKSRKDGGVPPGELPDHLQAVTKFPVDVKDLLTVRVKEDEKGRIPKIRMQPEKVKAMWWPGKGTFTRFNPQFCFEEAPEWTPAHILKAPPPRVGR